MSEVVETFDIYGITVDWEPQVGVTISSAGDTTWVGWDDTVKLATWMAERDPTTSALIRAALALEPTLEEPSGEMARFDYWFDADLAETFRKAAAAYRAAHPEAGRDGDG